MNERNKYGRSNENRGFQPTGSESRQTAEKIKQRQAVIDNVSSRTDSIYSSDTYQSLSESIAEPEQEHISADNPTSYAADSRIENEMPTTNIAGENYIKGENSVSANENFGGGSPVEHSTVPDMQKVKQQQAVIDHTVRQQTAQREAAAQISQSMPVSDNLSTDYSQNNLGMPEYSDKKISSDMMFDAKHIKGENNFCPVGAEVTNMQSAKTTMQRQVAVDKHLNEQKRVRNTFSADDKIMSTASQNSKRSYSDNSRKWEHTEFVKNKQRDKVKKQNDFINFNAYQEEGVFYENEAENQRTEIDEKIITGEVTEKEFEDSKVTGSSGGSSRFDRSCNSSDYYNRYDAGVGGSHKGVIFENTQKKKSNEHIKINTYKNKKKRKNMSLFGKVRSDIHTDKERINKAKGVKEKFDKMSAGTEDARLTAISEINQTQVISKVGMKYASTIQAATMKIAGLAMKLVKKVTMLAFKLFSTFFAAAIGIAGVPLAAVLVIVIILCVPPLSYLMGDYSSSSNFIIITYQDKLREFHLSVDAYDVDDNSTIVYTLDYDAARKDAMLLFLAIKGIDYDFNNISQEDAELYAELLTSMINCVCDISSYTMEINDGSLLTSKEIDVAERDSDTVNGNKYGAFRDDACNVHGIVSILNTSDGSYTHEIQEWYFIPCEVSQYSIIPLGTCLEITVTDYDGNRNNYILQVVEKMEDENLDNEMLYLCGDLGSELDGVIKDTNIITTAYGSLSWFSSFYTNLYNSVGNATPDKSVCYTGILDKQKANQSTDIYYNLRYRTPASLIEEFDMSDEEIEAVFSDFFDTSEEELLAAGIYVPTKTIYINNYGADTYAQLYLTAEEQEEYSEIADLFEDSEDIFDDLLNNLLGEISITNAIANIDTLYADEMASYDDTAEFLSDVLMINGFYVPANASQLAKFCDDNGYTIDINNYIDMQPGDICFVSTDYGTYKDVTDVIVKTENGYVFLDGDTGEIECESQFYYYTNSHRIGYNGVVMYARLHD